MGSHKRLSWLWMPLKSWILNVIFQFCFAIESGDISASLQEVVVPILSNSECRKSGYGSTRITDNMLCAGFKDGEKDSCQVGHFIYANRNSFFCFLTIQYLVLFFREIRADHFMWKMKVFIKLLASLVGAKVAHSRTIQAFIHGMPNFSNVNQNNRIMFEFIVIKRVNRYRTWIKSNTRDACYCE